MNPAIRFSASAATQPSFRLEISLPRMPLYSVDNILHVIAATSVPFSCGMFCSRCPISDAHEKKRSDAHIYDCEGLAKRHSDLRQLGFRLIKMIEFGRFYVWDAERRFAQECPWSTSDKTLNYLDFKAWARTSFIFPDDLATYLAAEKIHVRFVNYLTGRADGTGEDSMCAESNQQVEEPSDETTSKINSEEILQPATASCQIGSMASANHRKQRFDFLAVEINEMLQHDPELTPTEVGRALRAKVGATNTCMHSILDTGIRWKNARGQLMLATESNIASRVTRWKKSRGN